jgi:hypothetical protein
MYYEFIIYINIKILKKLNIVIYSDSDGILSCNISPQIYIYLLNDYFYTNNFLKL